MNLLAQNSAPQNVPDDLMLDPSMYGGESAPVAAQVMPTKTREASSLSVSGKMPRAGQDERYKQMIDDINSKELSSLKEQGLSVEALKQKLAALEGEDLPLNLQPLAALTDAWTGSNFTQVAKPEETKASRREAINRMQQQVLQAQGGLTQDELSLLKNKLAAQMQMDQFSYKKNQDQIQNNLERDKLNAMTGKTGNQFTPAEKKIDTDFGAVYTESVTKGGLLRGDLQLENLSEIENKIKAGEYGEISGPSLGAQPMAIRKLTNPQSVKAQQDIEQAVQGSMRETLGSQFTEKEGTQILQRTFDPTLPQEVNVERLNRVNRGLKAAQDAKKAAIQYYETEGKGSIRGYKGPSPEAAFKTAVGNLETPSKEGGATDLDALLKEKARRQRK